MTVSIASVRDTLIILAALAFALACVGGTLVMWQLYRLGRALHRDAQPVIHTALETVATLRDASTFMSDRVRSLPLPTARATGSGDDAPSGKPSGGANVGLLRAVQRFYGGRR